MLPRTQRTLQALILAGLGLFLLQKAWAGTLYWYINDRFLALVLGAAIGFLILARSVLPPWRAAAGAADNHPGGDDHACNHQTDHDHQAVPAWRLWMVALPIVLGLLIPARPLGSRALANKGLNLGAPLAAGGASDSRVTLPPAERTILDWVRAFNYPTDPGFFTGEPADVIGFVYHDAALGDDEFIISRFSVTCCAADAAGVGLLVQWPHAATLEADAWVRVRGPVQPGTYNDRPIPVVTAETVEGISPPTQPYLYP
jgi:putative membrane protein